MRAISRAKPNTTNGISPTNSAETSAMLEAMASGQETPASVTARAPNARPPTSEKGRQLVPPSRTSRPQIIVGSFAPGATTHQAAPRTMNSRSCQPTSAAKPGQPTDATASAILPAPNQTTRPTPSATPAIARTTEVFFTLGELRRKSVAARANRP